MTLNQQQLLEIEELRKQSNQTKRPVSLELEEILYEPFYALDHGFIRVIDYMGNDNAIVQSARVSYGSGTKKINADKSLINYLMAHRHTTPKWALEHLILVALVRVRGLYPFAQPGVQSLLC